MRLQSVQLSNIRSYEQATLEFPQGSLLLSGDIGCGKSTLLLAVEFALFGIVRGVHEGAGLLRHRAKTGSVTLKFSVEGHNVIVHRTLNRSSNAVSQGSGYLVIDDYKEELTPTELRARVCELLGYPLDMNSRTLIYRYAVFTPQERMKEIILADPQQRLSVLRTIFNIDKYRRAYDNSMLVLYDMRQQVAALQAQEQLLTSQIAQQQELIKDKENINEQFAQVSKELAVKRKDMVVLREQSQVLQQQYEVARSAQQQWDAVHAQETLLKKQLDQIGTRKERIAVQLSHEIVSVPSVTEQAVTDARQRYEHERKVYDAQKNTFMAATSEHKVAQQQLVMMKEQIASGTQQVDPVLITELEQRCAKFDAMNSLHVQRSQDIFSIENQIKQCQQHNDELIAEQQLLLDKDTCLSCGQIITAEYKKKVLEQSAERKKKLEQTIEGLREQLQAYKAIQEQEAEELKQLKSIEQQLVQMKERQRQVVEQQARHEKYKIKLEEYSLIVEKPIPKEPSQESWQQANDHWQKVQQQYTAWVKYQEEHKRRQELQKELEELALSESEIKKSVRGCIARKQELQPEVEKAQVLTQQLRESDVALQQQQEVIERLMTKAEQLNSSVKRCEEIAAGISQLKTHKITLQERIDSLVRKRSWLNDTVRQLFSTMERHVMISIYREYNTHFANWCRLLIDDENTRARIDTEFSPVIEQDGHDISIEYLSGGERTSVALAYRLALNKVINESLDHIKSKDLLILDEPTDGFSTEQLEKVRVVLQHVDAGQLIIVSHEQKVEGFVDHVIRIEKKEHESVICL